ncbi:MAG: hypothetical protein EBU21_12450, partial [Proteobacteria bacterium]|nr:hypothetical protein [Pseudomonadota bacterium]
MLGMVRLVAACALLAALLVPAGMVRATASSTPTLTAPGTQTAVKNGDTLTFGGTIGGTSLTIQSATLRQYSDTAATTEITGAAITLTVGSDISASGTTISGSKAVTFNANAVRVMLEVVVLDSSDNSTQTGTSPALTVDNTAPTASAVTFLNGSASGPFKSGTSVTMSVTSSESLSVAPVVTFSGAGTPTVTLTGSGTSWTGTVADLTGNGAVTYTMVLTDVAGNVTTTSSASAFTVDNIGPTYAITYSRTAPLSAGAVTVTVTANEALSGAPVISIDQPGTTDISSVTMSGSGSYTYSYTVVASTGTTYVDGTATVTVSGSDSAGNTGTTISSGGTFVIDTTPPVSTGVSLTSSDTGTASDRITSVAPVL